MSFHSEEFPEWEWEEEEGDKDIVGCGRCLARFQKDSYSGVNGCAVFLLPHGCTNDGFNLTPTTAMHKRLPTWKGFYGSRFDTDQLFLASGRAFPSPTIAQNFDSRIQGERYLEETIRDAQEGLWRESVLCDECVEWLLSCGLMCTGLCGPGDCWPACCCECGNVIPEPSDDDIVVDKVDLQVVSLRTDTLTRGFPGYGDDFEWYSWKPDATKPIQNQLCLRYPWMFRYTIALHDAGKVAEIESRREDTVFVLTESAARWPHGPLSRVCYGCAQTMEQKGVIRCQRIQDVGHRVG